jgi:MFS family permease
MIPALVDSGLSEQVAASMLAFSMVVSGGGRLIGGFLGDMIGAKRLLVTAFLAQAFSVVLFAFASSFVMAGIAALIFGVAFGARGTLLIMLRGEIFGRDSFARLSGLMDLLTMFGVVIAPMFAAVAYDTLGNYSVAFLVIAALNASGVFLLFYIDLPKRVPMDSAT